MIDPKVAENARQAWEQFVERVSRMQSRMLTAMAEKIDKQWADMVAETPEQRHDEPACCGERHVTECRSPDAAADETSQAGVGDGWRSVRTGEDAERLADGDWVQDADGFWEPISRFMWNGFGCPCKRYRRRVTFESKHVVVPAASTPLEAVPLSASQVTHGEGTGETTPDVGERLRMLLPAVVCEATKKAIDEIIKQGGGD